MTIKQPYVTTTNEEADIVVPAAGAPSGGNDHDAIPMVAAIPITSTGDIESGGIQSSYVATATTSMNPPSYNPPSTIYRLPFTVYHLLFTIHHPPSAIRRLSSSVYQHLPKTSDFR